MNTLSQLLSATENTTIGNNAVVFSPNKKTKVFYYMKYAICLVTEETKQVRFIPTRNDARACKASEIYHKAFITYSAPAMKTAVPSEPRIKEEERVSYYKKSCAVHA